VAGSNTIFVVEICTPLDYLLELFAVDEVAANDRVDISIFVDSHTLIHLVKDLFDDINEYYQSLSIELTPASNQEKL
jgi:hypothetical protein